MPYEHHGRLTFEGIRGEVTAPREAWSMRLNLNPVVPAGPGAPVSADLNALGSTWGTRVSPYLASDSILTSIKWAFIGPDGKYVNDPVLSADLSVAGSNAGIRFPDQVALAVSLVTATRGPRGRGRVYLPGPGLSMGAGAVYTATEASNIATSMAAFITAINGAWTDNGSVCVASSFGVNSNVTAVRVGRALDTIRSRRTSIVEDYSANVAVT